MSRVVQLEGGPLDGRRIRLYAGWSSFVWVELDPKGKCFLDPPGTPSVLYREVRHAYVFAGHTYGACGDCGAFIDRVDGHVVSCSLCGGALARSVS